MPKFILKNKIAFGVALLSVILAITFFGSSKPELPAPSPALIIEPIATIPSASHLVTSSPAKVETPEVKKTTGYETYSAKMTTGDTSVTLQFSAGNSLYDALLKSKVSGTLTFSGTNYPGLGFFVTDIGTLHQGNGKSLLYYINGKEATVGVSSYVLKDGDVIEWKLE